MEGRIHEELTWSLDTFENQMNTRCALSYPRAQKSVTNPLQHEDFHKAS